MASSHIFEALTNVHEDNFGWVRKLTGTQPKEQPAVIVDKSATKIRLKVGGNRYYTITRSADILNPRTKQLSYLWTARTDDGKPLGIEHSDPAEVIKRLKMRG
jgi:hypothetical protein